MNTLNEGGYHAFFQEICDGSLLTFIYAQSFSFLTP